MKERVTLQEAALTPDGAGGHETAWLDVAEVYAAARAFASREQVAQRQRADAATHGFILRWRKDVTPGMRVLWRGDAYEITACLDRDGRRAFIEVTARKAVP